MAGTADLSLRFAQGEVFQSRDRFRVLVAGRRFGKSLTSPASNSCNAAIEKAWRGLLLLRPHLPNGEGHRLENVMKHANSATHVDQTVRTNRT